MAHQERQQGGIGRRSKRSAYGSAHDSSRHVGGGALSALQRLFERLAGIAHDEAALRAQARRIFCTPVGSLAHLETPACWRRPARLRTNR